MKWVRVHRLQDFVYFNHAQHVEVGGIQCSKCHGTIEEMDEVYQFSDLTMGGVLIAIEIQKLKWRVTLTTKRYTNSWLKSTERIRLRFL